MIFMTVWVVALAIQYLIRMYLFVMHSCLQRAPGAPSSQHVQKHQLSIFPTFHGEVEVFEYVVDNFVYLQFVGVH